MNKVDKIIKKELKESIGVSARELKSYVSNVDPISLVKVIDRNGRECTISYLDKSDLGELLLYIV